MREIIHERPYWFTYTLCMPGGVTRHGAQAEDVLFLYNGTV